MLRSAPGQLLAAGQELTQTLSADGTFRNQVSLACTLLGGSCGSVVHR